MVKRTSLGKDGAKSWHLVERLGDDALSVTHQVEKGGVIIHQHQKHIGMYGTERRFPNEWIQLPDID